MPTALGTVASQRTVTAPPLPMTGLVGWYDADDASTFSYSSGVTVSQWRDKSGGARHVSGGSLQRNGSVNGRASVVAAGTFTAAQTAAPVMTNLDNFAMFIVCKWTGGAGTSLPLLNGTGSSNGYGPAVKAQGVNAGFLRGGVAWHASEATPDDGALHIHMLGRSSGLWQHFRDGGATSLNDGNFGAPAAPTGTTSIPSATAGHDFNGDVCEVLIYNVALSVADRQQVEAYLAARWFPPLPIPSLGLAGWWDAADTAMITASGGNITAWTDKSGKARTMADATSNMPTGVATQNGKNVVGPLVAGSKLIHDATTTSINVMPFTLFVALSLTAPPIDNGRMFSVQATQGGQDYAGGGGLLVHATSTGFALYVNSALSLAAVPVVNQWHIFRSAAPSEGGVWSVALDGAANTATKTGGMKLVRVLTIGATGMGGSTPCKIGDIILYNTTLSTVQHQQVENYLKTKWGIP